MLETPAKPQTALTASVCFDFFSLSRLDSAVQSRWAVDIG